MPTNDREQKMSNNNDMQIEVKLEMERGKAKQTVNSSFQ